MGLLNIPGRLEDTQVANFAEASALYAKLRDESGEGMRSWPDGIYYGCRQYRISYNGKVWDGPVDECELVYNPYKEA